MYDNYGMNADQQTNFNQGGGGGMGPNGNQQDFNGNIQVNRFFQVG